MTKIKKASIFLSTSIILLSSVSCGDKTIDSSSKNIISQTTYSLKTADISMSDNFSRILCLENCNDTVFVFGELSDGKYGGYTSDYDMKEFSGFSFEPDENETVITAALADDNTKLILTYKDDQTIIHRFNADGNEESAIECGDVLYDDMQYAKIIASDDGYYISVNNEYISYIDSSGNNKGEIIVGGKEIIGITRNSNDMPVVILSENNEKTMISSLNGTSLNDETVCSDMSSSMLTACRGIGDYNVSAVFYDALYGLKGTEWVKLCDFSDNNFGAYDISELIMIAENSFIAAVNTPDGAVLKTMAQQDSSETVEQEIVKIAKLPASDTADYFVREYNSLHGKYRIEFVDYTTEESVEDNIRNFKMDMITGNAPDIITYSPYIPIDTFGADSGIFMDLYTMIDSDPDLKREDFIDGLLEGMESDGKLLMIIPSFSIKSIECKDKFLGGLKSWNYEQMFDVYKKNHDEIGIDFSVDSKYTGTDEAFFNFINYYEFIDYENAKCSFDSKIFIEILEFFKENVGNMNPSGGWSSDMIWDKFKNDDIMLNITEEEYFVSLYSMENHTFGEPSTIIGYPTENGSESYIELGANSRTSVIFSITENSKVKDGAWDFIKTEFLSDRYYNGTEGGYIFPVIDKYLEKQLSDFNNLLIEEQNNGEDATPLTDEQMEEYISWVRENASNVVKCDYNVTGIIREEALEYFNSDISAEKTAERIQNRVSLYLSEQYQ